MIKLIAIWIILYTLFIHASYAADYQVKVYLDEIKAGTKPVYAASVTFRNTAGRVVKTNKNIFSAPVISLLTENRTCRTVSVKELELPVFNGFVITCSASTMPTPDYLMLNGEPK